MMDLQATDVELDLDIENDQVKLFQELWRMIFRKLDSHDLRRNLGLVCKEWHDIIQNDPLFSNELRIKKENQTENVDSLASEKLELTTENINSLLGSFPVLKKLEFYECENLILNDLDFNQCPSLEKVIFHISEFDSQLDCTVFKGSKCTLFPFLHTVHEISFHPKEDLEALNIANIQSLEILSVTQPRVPFSFKQLDQFDFKTFGINLRTNLETVTIHIRDEHLDQFETMAFRHSQLLTNAPKLKSLVICFSQEPAQLQDDCDGAFDRYLSGSLQDDETIITRAIKIFRSESEDEDMEEDLIYQCEICQIITDTKVEFVEHIEEKHSDVWDEEVLLSLKSEIRKSKKENGASEATPLSPPPKPLFCSNITKFEFKPLYGK